MARLFDLVVAVDWSAAASPGPSRPSADRCWLAWATAGRRADAEYFRTRLAAERRIAELLSGALGNALVAWDFPYGYPAGSGLGSGRALAARLAARIEDAEDGANNRFAVAAALNRELGRPPGPFWGCPPSQGNADLTEKKPAFTGRPYGEWRLVDRLLRGRGRNIQSAWKLYTTGSVGSQVLMGLPTVHRLASRPELAGRSKIWPFETGWDRALAGIVHAEMWPSLTDHQRQRHAIKDARQVLAARDWVLATDGAGRLGPALARPAILSDTAAAAVEAEEGWILGVA